MSGVAEGVAPVEEGRMDDPERIDGRGADWAVRERQRWPFWPPVAVLVVGLAVTAILAWVSAGTYTRNENRLLGLRAKDVGAVLTAALPSVQTPLASATALANATGGNVAKFEQFVAPYVGGHPFVSVSLWRVDATDRGPLAVVGAPPVLPGSTAKARAFFARASASSNLNVMGFLRHPPLRLGYAFTGTSAGRFAAYGESSLPSNRYTPVQNDSAFSDINFAFYLGRSPNTADLLIASVHRLPLTGRHATVRIPFGDTAFTLTVAARSPLAGTLPQQLPWAIGIVGAVLTIAATLLTVVLVKRRQDAELLARELEQVAEENRRLYAHQRTIAQTLQHALLPDALPQPPGLQVSARYEPGVEGVDIGGDWYDMIALDDRRLLLVVGDVSGKGLRAAATMASLRFAIHAYAAEGQTPQMFLPKLSGLVSVSVDRQIATVLCAVIDIPSHAVSVTSAGHLPPILIGDHGAELLETPVGLPVGVDRNASYTSTTISAPAGATLIVFTDGLVERRGENIDVGLERLRTQVSSNHVSLEQLLTRLLGDLGQDAPDDTAVAGIRWVN
jgi:hypothetical protein